MLLLANGVRPQIPTIYIHVVSSLDTETQDEKKARPGKHKAKSVGTSGKELSVNLEIKDEAAM